MNQFGGHWTKQKIDIVVDYAKAYLSIMNKHPYFKTMYFDGFAGSGNITKDESEMELIKGTAIRILEITSPKHFDMYYFVEKNEKNTKELEKVIEQNFNDRKYFVVNQDCNIKLVTMSNFLKENSNYKVLAFIDPYGMSVDWESIKVLKGLGIDLWILVPTGIGVNRMLIKDGNISESWYSKLERFLGISRDEIEQRFYKKVKYHNLFGDEMTIQHKERNTIHKINDLYRERLLTIFKFAFEAFVLRNSSNSIMYHFMMATNNKTALKIANDIIKPNYKL